MKILLLLVLAHAPFWQEAGTELKDVHGTVVKVGNLGYGLVPDDQPGTRYAPTNMDEQFHHDGLKVKFSGIVGAVPSSGRGGRVWGTPLELTAITLVKETPKQ